MPQKNTAVSVSGGKYFDRLRKRLLNVSFKCVINTALMVIYRKAEPERSHPRIKKNSGARREWVDGSMEQSLKSSHLAGSNLDYLDELASATYGFQQCSK